MVKMTSSYMCFRGRQSHLLLWDHSWKVASVCLLAAVKRSIAASLYPRSVFMHVSTRLRGGSAALAFSRAAATLGICEMTRSERTDGGKSFNFSASELLSGHHPGRFTCFVVSTSIIFFKNEEHSEDVLQTAENTARASCSAAEWQDDPTSLDQCCG